MAVSLSYTTSGFLWGTLWCHFYSSGEHSENMVEAELVPFALQCYPMMSPLALCASAGMLQRQHYEVLQLCPIRL